MSLQRLNAATPLLASGPPQGSSSLAWRAVVRRLDEWKEYRDWLVGEAALCRLAVPGRGGRGLAVAIVGASAGVLGRQPRRAMVAQKI